MSNIYRDVNIEFDKINSIGEVEIVTGLVADGSVTTDKIANGAVTRAKLESSLAEKIDKSARFIYGTCSTNADVSQKVIDVEAGTLSGYDAPLYLMLYLEHGNTASDPYIEVPLGGTLYMQVPLDFLSSDNHAIKGLYLFGQEIDNPYHLTLIDTHNNANRIWYGVCTSSSGAMVKIVPCDGFELEDGALIVVSMANANANSSPMLNVNNTGARSIKRANGFTSNAMISGRYLFRYLSANSMYEEIGAIPQANFTTALKNKLDGIETDATKNVASTVAPKEDVKDAEGVIGTSAQYARADHQHPAVQITDNFGDRGHLRITGVFGYPIV